jgi:hypothetical protein
VNSNHTAFTAGRKVSAKKCTPDNQQKISKNETSTAPRMPSGKNAENPMIIDNADFKKCVNFTLYASISHVIDKQRVLTSKNASISRITHKRTETAFLGVFPSNGYLHTLSQSKRLERASKARQRASKAFLCPNRREKTPNWHYL